MSFQTISSTQVSATPQIGNGVPQPQVRVYLLSDRTLLRDSLTRVLTKHADIQLVGANEVSVAKLAEVVEVSDVLLVDLHAMNLVDAQVLDSAIGLSTTRILKIQMNDGISELISRVVSVASTEDFSDDLLRLNER